MNIEHNLKFVTEFKEGHPVTSQMEMLDEQSRIELLEGMLKQLLAPMIQPAIDEINAGGSYAILKVAN